MMPIRLPLVVAPGLPRQMMMSLQVAYRVRS
jgi:hypothetical protein